MIRAWPDNIDHESLTVRFQKSIFLILVTGMFSVLMVIVIPLILWARFNNKLPGEIGASGFVFMVAMLLLFGLVAISALISSIRNFRNPSIRFIANREGIFMNITFKQRDAFFASWNDIENIEQIEVNMGVGKGKYTDIAIAIFLSENKKRNLPKVLRGVIGSKENYIAFAQGTMDVDLAEVLNRLNTMKRAFETN